MSTRMYFHKIALTPNEKNKLFIGIKIDKLNNHCIYKGLTLEAPFNHTFNVFVLIGGISVKNDCDSP